MKITALTSCCVDFFPEQGKKYVGGNSLNFATQCRLLGEEDISVIGAVGNDQFGRLIADHFDKLNIEPSQLRAFDEYFKSLTKMYSSHIDFSTEFLRNYSKVRISMIQTYDNYMHNMMQVYSATLSQFNSFLEK